MTGGSTWEVPFDTDQDWPELSKAKVCCPPQVKLLQPLHQCARVGDVDDTTRYNNFDTH